MKTAKHTPGPWTRHEYSQKGIQVVTNEETGEHWMSRHITIGAGKKIIGNVELATCAVNERLGFPHVTNESELEANAALFGAAPDLLAACKRTIAFYGKGDKALGAPWDEMKKAVEKADAVLK